jgi:hypothetical protein
VTLILAGVYARQSVVTPLKRACIDRLCQLRADRVGNRGREINKGRRSSR